MTFAPTWLAMRTTHRASVVRSLAQASRSSTAKDGVLHEFVFVQMKSNGTVGQMHRLSLAEVEALLAPAQWRVRPGVWADPE